MSKEAMKLALEALRMPCNFWNKVQFIRVTEAIKALEEALAKQEQGEPAYRCVPYSSVPNQKVSDPVDYYTTPQQRKPLDCFETEKLAKQCGVEWTTRIDKLCKLAAAHSIKELK